MHTHTLDKTVYTVTENSNIYLKGKKCNISALECLKMTRHLLHTLLSCLRSLSKLFPTTFKAKSVLSSEQCFTVSC